MSLFKYFISRKRWLFRIFLGAVIFCLLVCWIFPQEILTVESGPTKADVIVILGGSPLDRPKLAGDLFREGAAAKILVSGAGDCEQSAQLLQKADVPEEALVLECESHTTFENAKFSVPILRKLDAKRVIIVTSWYHSRRALACFKHFAPEIQFYSRPSYAEFDRKQWQHGTRKYIRSEYIKILGYWLRYGVWPF
jgi:uncharacterized SAM-binding protein YcdF (DUF218 family)